MKGQLSRLARKPSPATVIAIVALVVAATGAAVANIPGSNGVIHGCYLNDGGNIRAIDLSKGQSCKATETELNWNQTGPRGPSDVYATDKFTECPIRGCVAGTPHKVIARALPAGLYVVFAKVTLVALGTGGYPREAQCDLIQERSGHPEHILDRSFAYIPSRASDGAYATIAVHGLVAMDKLGLVKMRCDTSGPSGAKWKEVQISPPFIAIQIGALH